MLVFYNIGDIFIDYSKWHYKKGLSELGSLERDLLRFVVHFFSFKLLLHTLFHPLKRLQEGYRGGFHMEDMLSSLLVNTVMRFVGFSARISIIIIGALAYVGLSIISLVLLLAWVLAPILIIILFAASVSLMTVPAII